jgi:hypothetical protein
MNLINLLLLSLLAVYILTVMIIGILFVWSDIRNRRQLKRELLKQISNGIPISVESARRSAMGIGLSASAAGRVINSLIAETEDAAVFNQLMCLADDLERIAPFEGLPDEVKPSLNRLAKLCDASEQSDDKDLLIPIQNCLSKFVDLEMRHKRERKLNNVANIAGLISLGLAMYAFWWR